MLFEKLAKNKIRFKTERGALSAEDLFDLPLEIGPVNLNDIAKQLDEEIRSQQKSFVNNSKPDEFTKLAFDAVLRVIEIRLEEIKQDEADRLRALKKKKILSALEQRELDELASKSTKELKKELKKVMK